MPKHYYYVANNKLLPLDVEKKTGGSVDDIITILKERPLVFKKCTGGHGTGLFIADYKNEKFRLNDECVNEAKMRETIESLDDYIITEYVRPHRILRERFGEDNFEVIRAATIFDAEEGPQITSLILKTGTTISGSIPKIADYICSGIDIESGVIFKSIMQVDLAINARKAKEVDVHPDTKQKIIGTSMPDFKELRELLLNVATQLPMATYMCYDIILSDEGYKILEINSHGQMDNFEPFFPVNKNKYYRKIFKPKVR